LVQSNGAMFPAQRVVNVLTQAPPGPVYVEG